MALKAKYEEKKSKEHGFQIMDQKIVKNIMIYFVRI